MWRDFRFAAAVVVTVALLALLYFARPMLVVGAAFDPDGQPIDGAFAYSRSGGYGAARDAATGSGSNRFFAGCLLCVNLEARVLAEGYETEEIQISPHFEPAYGDRMDVWRGPLALFSRARVTLYPEQSVEAERFEGEVLFADGTPRLVLSLHPEVSGQMTPERLQLRLRQVTRRLENVAPYVALEAELAADGSVAVLDGPDGREPRALWLVLHNAEGGFLQVGPLSGLPDYNGYLETVRRLREAPAGGYLQRLKLYPGLAHFDGDSYFLYVRVDDRFGRLQMPVPWVIPRQAERVSARVRLILNASGGRVLPIR